MGLEFASSASSIAGESGSGESGSLTIWDLLERQPFCPGCGCRLQLYDPSKRDFGHVVPHGLACRRCRKKVRIDPPLVEIPAEEIHDRPGGYWIPSPAEIAAECAEIQKEWNPLEERRRAGQFPAEVNDRQRTLKEFRESGDVTTWTAPECRNHAF